MEKVRIQDDLYTYVNQEKLEQLVIPSDRPCAGGFNELDQDVEKIMTEELNQMSESGVYPNIYLERAIKLFNAVKDVKRRNKEGIKPAKKALAKIEKLTDIASLNRHYKEFLIEGLPLPFEIGVEVNMKDAEHHMLYLQGPSTILPDTTYYKEEMAPQRDAILGMWSNMVKALLKYASFDDEKIETYVNDALKYDAIIATLVKSSEEWSEYTKMYNPTSVRKVSGLVKPLKFNKLLKDVFGEAPSIVSLTDPRFFNNFKTLFNEENFELYKHWAYITELLGSTNYLSEELRELGGTYQRALTGVQQMSSPEKFAYRLATSLYSEPVGMYYGEKYFGEEAKADVVDMVKDIINTYKLRIKNNEFLSESTKDKAIVKLDTMVIKMGYPDKVEEIYDKLVFEDNDNLYTIMQTLSKIKRINNLEKLYKPVDRNVWAMPGHLVNACYNPTSNDITFPAAILQAPFYSIKQTRSQNLGGIGAVIGHEISHAFDNNGANCDEKGNLVNWWTKEDFKNFNKKTKAMVAEFEGITLPWGEVNSNLIVSENIADNGGMAVTLEIMKNLKDASYEEYFMNWARVWCLKANEQYLQVLLRVDVHAPAILRANMQPRNFEEWYTTFNVTKNDKMYIEPKKRVVIW